LEARVVPRLLLPSLEASVSADAPDAPAWDDRELQAPVPSSLLLRPGVSERLVSLGCYERRSS